jgi:hypothetical protein
MNLREERQKSGNRTGRKTMADDIERVSKEQDLEPVSMGEIEAEDATALPDKEVMSLLDVNANVDLGLDLAAPVDLAVAANLNVAAPIEAAAGANLLSDNAEATAVAQQAGTINQAISGSAEATAPQNADISQGADPDDPAAPPQVPAAVDPETGLPVDPPGELPVPPPTAPDVGADLGDLLENGSLLHADVDINADANVTAPINGAVAANANVAAPIDAAVAANIGSDGATAQALADQQVNINQTLDDVSAEATAEQNTTIDQP